MFHGQLYGRFSTFTLRRVYYFTMTCPAARTEIALVGPRVTFLQPQSDCFQRERLYGFVLSAKHLDGAEDGPLLLVDIALKAASVFLSKRRDHRMVIVNQFQTRKEY